MNKRVKGNKNLIIHNQPVYNGRPVQLHRGPLIQQQLEATHTTMKSACDDYSRVTGIRFDLHYPAGEALPDQAYSNDVLKAFFGSLNARIECNRQGKVHNTVARYIWCREYGKLGRPHYHVAMLFNGYAYRSLGWFKPGRDNLYWRIVASWASALGISLEEARGLVHIPDNAVNHIDKTPETFDIFFHRVSYMCKEDTKRFSEGLHTFGTSRI